MTRTQVRATPAARLAVAVLALAALTLPLVLLSGERADAAAPLDGSALVQVVAGQGTDAALTFPGASAVTSDGDLIVIEQNSGRVVRVSDGVVTTVATGLGSVSDVVSTPGGDVYVAVLASQGSGGGLIRIPKTSSGYDAPALVLGASFNEITALAIRPGTQDQVYVADWDSTADRARVFEVDVTTSSPPTASTTLIAGSTAVNAVRPTPSPGVAAASAQLTYLTGVVVTPSGDLYLAQYESASPPEAPDRRLVRIHSTVAVTVGSWSSYISDLAADGGDALYVLSEPTSINLPSPLHVVAIDGSGNPGTTQLISGVSGDPLPSTTPSSASATKLGLGRTLAFGGGRAYVVSGPVSVNNGVASPGGPQWITALGRSVPLALTSPAPPSGATGSAYLHHVTTSGFPAPAWTVTSGSLPSGLTLGARSGLVSGTPTAAGTFTVTGTSSAGTVSRTITVTATSGGGGGGGGGAAVSLLPQTVTATGPGRVSLAGSTVRVKATASAGGVLTFRSSDAGVASVDGAGVLELRAAGTTTVTVSAAATATHAAATADVVVTVTPPRATSLPTGTVRLAGADRVATAVDVSRRVFADPEPGAATAVVLATSGSFADALAGSRLAGQAQAPLLLTDRDGLDGDVAAEVRRLLRPGGTVYLLGGDGALAPGVQRAVQALSDQFTVERLGGADRYATAVRTAEAVVGLSGDTGPIYLVTGKDFADGVAVGAFAQRTGGVVLLTDGPRVPPATAAYLARHDPSGTRVVPVGGAAAAAARMSGYAGADERQVVGVDRYATAAELARRYASTPTAAGQRGDVPTAGLAGGTSWPDALAGSAAMAHLAGPLLLTPAGADVLHPGTREALRALGGGPERTVVFGGQRAVSAAASDAAGRLRG